MSVTSDLENIIVKSGFEHFGFAQMGRPQSIDQYKTWIESEKHADMEYLKSHLSVKETPQLKWSWVKSAIVITNNYVAHPKPQEFLKGLRTALYSQGEDYHFWFLKQLTDLSSELSNQYPHHQFLAWTDSGPILERDLAYRAGLGWVGKNTCLIHPKKGSLFFIGEILTDLEIPTATLPVPDFCGTCTKCIDICPTKALKPKELDARLCISYWNIEAKAVASPELRSKMNDWFFGCDLCQTVCPWNQKNHSKNLLDQTVQFTSPNQDSLATLQWILSSSNGELERQLKNSPLIRARGFGLKRNALIVIGNLRLKELKSDVESFKLKNSRLSELAGWTLQQLSK